MSRPGQGSVARLMVGALLIIVALVTAVYGFVALIRVLDGGGYGTQAMRWALVLLGTAGALLAAGIATVIWDVAKRYESPTEAVAEPVPGKTHEP